MAKSVSLNLRDLMTLYLFKLRHLLHCCINLCGDFFDEIGSSHKYFDHKIPMHQPGIVEIVVYRKIKKKRLYDKHEAYNNKMHIV